MSKAFFRFLRGEINGFYLTSIQAVCNNLSSEYKTFLNEFKKQQFEKGKISNETLYNLGKFAGIFLPRISKEEASTSIRLTESEIVDGNEYSERGLYKPAEEAFEFEQETQSEAGLPDINTLATSDKRSSMVNNEPIAGYIPDDVVNIFDDDNKVLPSVLSSEPPANQAYSDFYSDDFIFLSDALPSYESLSPDVFMELFKAIQVVRYRGMNVKSLMDITSILCPLGLVKLDSITAETYNWKLTYTIDISVDVGNQQDRINMWLYILKIKFPQLVAVEV